MAIFARDGERKKTPKAFVSEYEAGTVRKEGNLPN